MSMLINNKIHSIDNKRIVIIIPTYNEIDNVETILKQILSLKLETDIIFIDDNSPDGTGDKLDQLSKDFINVSVLHRKCKIGVGSAIREGIQYAYDNGYQILITMDSDFSHSPEFIPEFLQRAKSSDIVVGSRFIKKKSLKEWNLYRKLLTHIGHVATTHLLQMPYDSTGGFRLYRLDQISRDFLDKVSSNSYAFTFETLFVLHYNNYLINEFPLHLPARVYGSSKMSTNDVFHSLWCLLKIFILSNINKGFYSLALTDKSN